MSGAAQSDPHPLRELASQLTIPAAICLCIVVSFASIALVTVSVNMLVDWFLKTMDAALPDEL